MTSASTTISKEPMNTRLRGLLILSGSLLVSGGAYWLLFHVLADPRGMGKILEYPMALALAGVMVGLLELGTGVPIQRIDKGWQRLPAYVQAPVAIVGGLLFLWGLVKLLGF